MPREPTAPDLVEPARRWAEPANSRDYDAMMGNGLLFAVVVQTARPAGSTGSVQRRYAAVSIWADGLCERTRNYSDIDEARAAAARLAEERG